jgi:hypothetical protein
LRGKSTTTAGFEEKLSDLEYIASGDGAEKKMRRNRKRKRRRLCELLMEGEAA